MLTVPCFSYVISLRSNKKGDKDARRCNKQGVRVYPRSCLSEIATRWLPYYIRSFKNYIRYVNKIQNARYPLARSLPEQESVDVPNCDRPDGVVLPLLTCFGSLPDTNSSTGELKFDSFIPIHRGCKTSRIAVPKRQLNSSLFLLLEGP